MHPRIKDQPHLNKIHDVELLNSIINSISEGVIILNKSSVVVGCNDSAKEILELAEDEIIGTVLTKKGWTLLQEDGSPFKIENLPSVITSKTGKPCHNLILGVKTTAFLKWLKVNSRFDEIGNQQLVVISFTDVTEQIEINNNLFLVNDQLHDLIDELGKSESKFFNAFNYSAIGIALLSLTGKWLDVNPMVCEMLGYTKDELLLMTLEEITLSSDVRNEIGLSKELIAKKRNSYQVEKRCIHKNGRLVILRLCVSLVWKNNDTPDFFIAQVIDITKDREMTNELEFKNKILQTTTESLEKRMNQVNQFSHIVAHNLRGPSSTIHMLIDLLVEEKNEASRDQYFKLLSMASDQFQNTLQDLLQLLQTELETGENEVEAQFEETVLRVKTHLMASIIPTNATITAHFEVPSINIPKAVLESIIYNLLSNAIKYSKRNVAPVIEISTKRKRGKIQLKVKDNGIGIDLEKYGSDLFSLNKTFHTGYDSKGIGLYMTKNQIVNAGGSIEVKSIPVEGTTFIVTF